MTEKKTPEELLELCRNFLREAPPTTASMTLLDLIEERNRESGWTFAKAISESGNPELAASRIPTSRTFEVLANLATGWVRDRSRIEKLERDRDAALADAEEREMERRSESARANGICNRLHSLMDSFGWMRRGQAPEEQRGDRTPDSAGTVDWRITWANHQLKAARKLSCTRCLAELDDDAGTIWWRNSVPFCSEDCERNWTRDVKASPL